ncbi:PAS domain S-box protein [Lyngbya sp. CCY1209]|uniref:PAS domain S-box protein n=1 Tax=Lyngbya sp. CCY1209 TaxID=2886103 RepID=UPI002D203AD7|nr:PAS domain S-box protein [Lyngbya sp. CCY1209]MEB3885432.1 PAS domain S-box protein [Lyngbya sp. CCY1209]
MFANPPAFSPDELKAAIIREPLVVSPTATVMDAIARMSEIRASCPTASRSSGPLDEAHLEARSSCVLVVEGGRLLGILTERDVVRLSTRGESLGEVTVGEAMSTAVVSLRESEFDDFFAAVELLRKHRIRHLPILDDRDRVAGLLTHESLRQAIRPADLLRLRTVAEVMTPEVVSASPDADLLEIARLMAARPVSCVVLATTGTATGPIPVGILTERDLVQFQALGLDLETSRARQVMSTPIFSVRPEDTLWAVQEMMNSRHIRRVVVTGPEGQLLGIVTQSSLLRVLNPLELYKLAEVLEQKVFQLEIEKVQLLENQATRLEREIRERTAALEQSRRREQLVFEITTEIRSSLSLPDILDRTADRVRDLLKCDRIALYQFAPDWGGKIVAESVAEPCKPCLHEQIEETCFRERGIDAYQNGRIFACNDIYQAGLTECHLQLLERFQVRANLVVPVVLSPPGGAVAEPPRLWGLFVIHQCSGPRDWSEEEIQMMRQLAAQVAIAILQATAHEALETELRERREAERRLEESEQRYATLTDLVSVGIFRTDIEGNCIYANGRYCQIAGVAPAEVIGNPWHDSLHPDDRSRVLAVWENTVQTESPFEEEYRLQKPDSSAIWVFGQVVPELDDADRLIGYIGTIADIGDRKQAELTLQDLNQSLETQVRRRTRELQEISSLQKAILDGTDYALISTDTDGTILTFNAGAERMLGYRAEEVVNRMTPEPFHDREEIRSCAAKRSAELGREISPGFEVFTVEPRLGANEGQWTYIRKDGTRFPVSLSVTALRDERGEVSGFLGVARDITDRKRAESDRRELLRKLSDFHRALDESAIVAITDPKGIITYANDRFCEISGYSRPELLGNTHRLLNSGYHPPEFFRDLWQTISGGQIWRGEIRNRAKDGRIYWTGSTIVPFLDSRGRVFQHLAIRFDITARKRAETDLQRNNALLQTIGRAQAQFITAGNRLTIFEDLLEGLLELTDSEYGFIGEVLFRENGGATMEESFMKIRGVPYLKTHSITNIAWDEATRKFYEDNYEKGMEFDNLNSLFGAVILTGEPVIANSPRTDPRRGGTPDGHPPLNAFLGLPFFSGSDLVGMVGIANRPGGYDGAMVEYLQPVLVTCSNLIEGYRLDRRRREAEAARLAAERQAAKQLASIEVAVDGIAILDGEIYQYLNPAHGSMFGYDSSELLGKSWRQLYSPEELRRFEEEVFPVLMRDRTWKGEATATRKDGSTFAEDLSLTLTEDNLLICVCRDVSDRKETEARLRKTNEELQRATRLKDEFLANMSHELRTPLNAILGMTEGLQEEVFGPLNDSQKKSLKTVEGSAHHLLELINDILDLAKIEAGQMELDRAPTAIEPLCRASLTFVRQQAHKKGIRLDVQIPPGLPDLVIDERRIRQVLINLLNNAVKFTPDRGTVTLRVSWENTSKTPGAVRFVVADTGIGISPEHLEKLFKPFTQIDSALNRQYEGTGLGLSLVKRIVELHGGDVSVASDMGKGSRFSVHLPCDDILMRVPKLPASGPPESLNSPDEIAAANPRILLAEDNEANTLTLSSYLQAKGYRVTVAKDGEEAIRAVEAECPDLILMDIQMPKMDGLEAIRRIRNHPNFAGVPIVALTALAMDGDREKCLAAGADEYLPKPVKLKQLTAMIQDFLGL